MKVLTIGTFDTPHAGHIRFLAECKTYGQLFVGINSDRFVKKYKGEAPLFTYKERRQLIAPFCDRVVSNDSAGKDLINRVKPDLLAIGSDWLDKDYLTQIDVSRDWLDAQGISLIFIPYTPNISTSEIKRRVSYRHQ